MKTMNHEELHKHMGATCKMTIVDVLSSKKYDVSHLPGAINVPMDEDFDEKVQQAVPDKTQMVVVYCGSAKCSASEEAAEHLEKLGYKKVYDYEAGKADWEEAGLPMESCACKT